MPIISILLLMLSLTTSVAGQESKGQAVPEKSQDRATSSREIVELPLSKRVFRPKISLQEAMKLAESYIKKERIDASSYYLLEARMIQYGGETDAKEPRWSFLWVHEGWLGTHIEITSRLPFQWMEKRQDMPRCNAPRKVRSRELRTQSYQFARCLKERSRERVPASVL
jgi:hypothetical protein